MKQIRPLSILKNKQQETHCLLLLEVPVELDELLSDRFATPTELVDSSTRTDIQTPEQAQAPTGNTPSATASAGGSGESGGGIICTDISENSIRLVATGTH